MPPRSNGEAAGRKPQVPDSPALKKAKAQYRQAMTEIRKLAAAKHPLSPVAVRQLAGRLDRIEQVADVRDVFSNVIPAHAEA